MPGFRSGQWVKFEFSESVKIVAIDPRTNRAQIVTAEDDLEIERMRRQIRTGADGRFIGIYLQGARTPDGRGGFVHMPPCVAPQRAVLGPAGEQNLTRVHDGLAVTLLLEAASLQHLAPTLDRGDLPPHRQKTCAANWEPRP